MEHLCLTGSAIRASEFKVTVDGVERFLLDVAQSNYHRQFHDDEEKSEYFVLVEWLCTKPINEAASEVGFFGNQNTVARPKTHKWNYTIEQLKQRFGVE